MLRMYVGTYSRLHVCSTQLDWIELLLKFITLRSLLLIRESDSCT
jgi:hypothetical protein